MFEIRPHSDVWQELVKASELSQEELDRLLREKVSSKPRPTQKQRVKEAIQWLLEAGASLEAPRSLKRGSKKIKKGSKTLLNRGALQ